MRNHLIFQFFTIFIILGLLSCRNAADSSDSADSQIEDASRIWLEAEQFNNKEGNILVEDIEEEGTMITVNGQGWLSYNLYIPVAGRYRVELKTIPEDTINGIFWIEDHTDNEDGRTYNITGNMICSPSINVTPYTIIIKDGSPLDKGMHKIKIHFSGGKSTFDWASFSIMKEHQLTPEILTQNTKGTEWVLAWSDEFEGSGYPDESKWIYDIGDWGWGNNELQYYTEKRIENARLEDGNLIIEARKDSIGNWSSARLTTRGKQSFLYGKIEFRAKVPAGRGNWVAGWTLGDDYVDEKSWPYCGEIDILESVGFELDDPTGDGKAHASIHCPAYYFKLNNQPTGTLEVSNMEEEYHIYSLEWTEDKIIALVDDQPYFEYSDTSTKASWPFDKAQNIILNLAMGGGWGGAQGIDENIESQLFIIDYVRVFERS